MIEAAKDLQDDFFTRLDRYLIADDAELLDVTDHWQTYHLLTENQSLIPSLPQPHHIARNINRFGIPGIDITLPTAEAPLIHQQLAETNGPPLSQEDLENRRIANGIATWGAELTPGLLPPEARLEARAIDYAKGCYTGQEVISRIKMAGKVNRLLSLFTVEASSGTAPETGDAIVITGEESTKVVGHITSLSPKPTSEGERLALGFLKSHHATEHPTTTTFITQPREEGDGNRTSQITLQPFPKHDS